MSCFIYFKYVYIDKNDINKFVLYFDIPNNHNRELDLDMLLVYFDIHYNHTLLANLEQLKLDIQDNHHKLVKLELYVDDDD